MGFKGRGRKKKRETENKKKSPDNDSQTQPIESHSPSPEAKFEDGHNAGTSLVQSSMLLDDTLSLESNFSFETEAAREIANLDEETQLAEDPTCINDPCKEIDTKVRTQLVDGDTQEVCVNSSDEGTDTTELLSDGDELSDSVEVFDRKMENGENRSNLNLGRVENGLEKRGLGLASCSFDQEKNFVADSDASTDDEGIADSGFAQRAFASVRTASVRTSGLSAAHAMAPKRTEIGENSRPINIQAGLKEDKVVASVPKSPVRNTRARKLFHDSKPTENEASLMNNSTTDSERINSSSLPACDHVVAGLSYVGSQEPGEFSQANALGFVDKLLSINDDELTREVDPKEHIGVKSAPVSSVKGPQSLAKKAGLKGSMEEVGTYDWIDSREDETGGDFFCKKKQALFESRDCAGRSRSVPQKPQQIMDFTRSDSRLMLSELEKSDHVEISKAQTKKNLFKELGEQLKGETSREQVETTDTYDVGPDTQLAAEAMEALVCGLPVNCDFEDAEPVKQKAVKSSTRALTRNTARSNPLADSKRVPLGKRVCSVSDSETATRQSKQMKTLGSKVKRVNPACSRQRSKNLREKDVIGRKSAKKIAKKEKLEHKTDRITDEISSIKVDRCNGLPALNGHLSASVGILPEGHTLVMVTPVACRTRQSLAVKQLQRNEILSSESQDTRNKSHPKGRRSRKPSSLNNGVGSNLLSENCLNGPSVAVKQLQRTEILSSESQDTRNKSHPKGRRSRKPSSLNNGLGSDFPSDNCLNGPSVAEERSEIDTTKRKTRSGGKEPSPWLIPEGLPKEKAQVQPAGSVCTTPLKEANAVSPVCIGDDTGKQLYMKCLTRSSLKRELIRLEVTEPEPSPATLRVARRRRDMAGVRVLFSHHLGDNIIKQQKKLLARLGVSIACSASDATHFVADEFVRTRNMLETMALGKPVVTPLWLESCAQASCFIDEKKYILRDTKKEKEIGFSMSSSLACAHQNPLLQGKRVLVTPNIKPNRELIVGLVKEVGGQAVERIGRSATKDDKILDDLLVFSCEEDYAICAPLIEKGSKVYSSELLLNGIVIQKLEYERHRLFLDHVKRSRSLGMVRK